MSRRQEEVRSDFSGRHSMPESRVELSNKEVTVLSSDIRRQKAFAFDTSLLQISDVQVDHWPVPIIEDEKPLPLWYRAFEKLVAVVALVVFALPMLIIGLIVRHGSSGPALFYQERCPLGYYFFGMHNK